MTACWRCSSVELGVGGLTVIGEPSGIYLTDQLPASIDDNRSFGESLTIFLHILYIFSADSKSASAFTLVAPTVKLVSWAINIHSNNGCSMALKVGAGELW